MPGGKEREEVIDERGDVVASIAERGDLQLDDVEAVVEVLAEGLLADHRREIAVRRRDDAHRDRLFARGAERAHGPLLQRAQEARLHLERHLADLVEQQRPPVGLAEEPLLVALRAGERPLHVAEQLALQQVRRDGAAVHAEERHLRARRLRVHRLGDDLLAGAALARDEHGDVRVLEPIEQRVQTAHRRARPDEATVAEVAPQLGARLLEIATHGRELLGLAIEKPGQLVARRLELDVRGRQLLRARLVLLEEPRVLDRDGGLVGERGQRGELGFEARAGAKARLDVERADRPPRRGSAADGDARDRLDRERVHALGLRQAQVVLRVRRDHRLARPHDALGHRVGERRVGVVPLAAAGGARLELAVLVGENDEPVLRAEQRDGVVGDPREEPVHVVLGGEVAGDLEDQGESVLRGERGADGRVAAGARARAGGAARRVHRRRHRHRRRMGNGRRVCLAKRATTRVVPEDLAQIARELRRGLLEHGQRLLRVAPGRGDRSLRRRQPRPRVERAPRPLALRALGRLQQRLVQRRSCRRFVPREHRDRPARDLRQRLVLAEPPLARLRADGLELA